MAFTTWPSDDTHRVSAYALSSLPSGQVLTQQLAPQHHNPRPSNLIAEIETFIGDVQKIHDGLLLGLPARSVLYHPWQNFALGLSKGLDEVVVHAGPCIHNTFVDEYGVAGIIHELLYFEAG
ncbi:uncharacterized protein JN550_004745 [Neoarthrinium moseri]|uniref:uncharacterized protein n=1 Tax=Neoarthrinium moseri TaxID=1658444 RepID=UPI001FDB56C8|nr:uncharacterized protein JN550_004745 [Neoarthrinium moseri]KAI1871300.1 hypothetical protein JN550_004745 [Neoarthrinium moseri]